MKPSLTNKMAHSQCGGDSCERLFSGRSSSVDRVFVLFLAAFFALQVAVGVGVIVFYIGGEMFWMQTENIGKQLEENTRLFQSYVDDRLALMHGYSRMPRLVAGVMSYSTTPRETLDFIKSLPLLDDAVDFCLQDARSVSACSSQGFVHHGLKGEGLARLLGGKARNSVGIFTAGDMPERCYLRLSVPVNYQGSPQGVFSAFIPMSTKDLLSIFNEKSVRVSIVSKGQTLISNGVVVNSGVTRKVATRFPGIDLVQEVSRIKGSRRIQNIEVALIATLFCGTLLILVMVYLIGKRLFIDPLVRLQAMSKALEKDVAKRTANLERQTIQLSMEIRERREAEEEARESEELVSTLLEGINAAVIIIDPITRHIIRSNAVVQRMFGLAPWQILKRSCDEAFVNSPDVVTDPACSSDVAVGYSEGVGYHVDGTSFPLARYKVKVEVKGEEHVGIILLDISERKVLERRLNMAQKLESVGELASGIAHEINTPIQYVGDSISFVYDAFSDVAKVVAVYHELYGKCREAGFQPELLERIDELFKDADLDFVMQEVPKACTRALEGSERVGVIVRAMKDFAHPGDGQKKGLDINTALTNTLTVAKNEWKFVADVVEDFGDIPIVHCLPGDINQVFLNIIVNAAHAIGDVVGNSGNKGTITVATREERGNVVITIRDTGAGILPENREKIFDPFFTTKEVGRGTGQGLAIVHDIIVERHGGTIDFESEMGKGTTFTIILPLGE